MEACDITGCSRPLAAVRRRRHLRRKPPAAISPFASVAPPSPERGAPEGRRMFVFGMGFVGRYVSGRLREEGWEVSGTCTSVPKKKELEEMGFNAFVFDARENELKYLNALPHATHLLISIPPTSNLGDPLLFLQEDLQSVYGDCGGAWVDENIQANPIGQTAKARLAAEQGWLALGHDLGTSTYVFRLGGIYGPGRSALNTIVSQEALSKYQKMRESRKYTARVHVADIYQAIKASFTMSSTGGVYNVVDDDPAPRAEVFAFAQELIEEKWPGMMTTRSLAMDAVDTEMRGAVAKGEKRVSNARLKKELGVSLIHPSYRSGLQSILDSLESPNLGRTFKL